MSSLTIQEYKEKISQVEKDISTLRLSGASGRKLDVLCEDKESLEEELLYLINEKNQPS